MQMYIDAHALGDGVGVDGYFTDALQWAAGGECGKKEG
jgi:hypothetical protein